MLNSQRRAKIDSFQTIPCLRLDYGGSLSSRLKVLRDCEDSIIIFSLFLPESSDLPWLWATGLMVRPCCCWGGRSCGGGHSACCSLHAASHQMQSLHRKVDNTSILIWRYQLYIMLLVCTMYLFNVFYIHQIYETVKSIKLSSIYLKMISRHY